MHRPLFLHRLYVYTLLLLSACSAGYFLDLSLKYKSLASTRQKLDTIYDTTDMIHCHLDRLQTWQKLLADRWLGALWPPSLWLPLGEALPLGHLHDSASGLHKQKVEEQEENKLAVLPVIDQWDKLSLSNLESLSQSIDHHFAGKLAASAKRYAMRRNGKGLCLRGVRIALSRVFREHLMGNLPSSNLHSLPRDSDITAFLDGRESPGRSAESFRKWAMHNPVSLCYQLGLADVSAFPLLHRKSGFIHVYGKGSCGFHRRYGHIEIVTNEQIGEVCSDHCRTRTLTCRPQLVLAPVRSCDWLVLYQHHLNEVVALFTGDALSSLPEPALANL